MIKAFGFKNSHICSYKHLYVYFEFIFLPINGQVVKSKKLLVDMLSIAAFHRCLINRGVVKDAVSPPKLALWHSLVNVVPLLHSM